jgi:hypothetical protein
MAVAGRLDNIHAQSRPLRNDAWTGPASRTGRIGTLHEHCARPSAFEMNAPAAATGAQLCCFDCESIRPVLILSQIADTRCAR